MAWSVSADRIRRIAEGDEGVGAGALGFAEQRREILRADRIALVIGELEFCLLKAFARGLRQIDAETVGDADHGDVVVDLAVLAHLRQQVDQRIDILL